MVKFYDAEPAGAGRYSPPRVVRAQKHIIAGAPDRAHISTSMIERQNLTMRMSMRRFTRLTNAFSKKLENLQAAVSLQFAHYNFVTKIYAPKKPCDFRAVFSVRDSTFLHHDVWSRGPAGGPCRTATPALSACRPPH